MARTKMTARKNTEGMKLRTTFPLVPVKKELVVKEISSEDQDHEIKYDRQRDRYEISCPDDQDHDVLIARLRQQVHSLAKQAEEHQEIYEEMQKLKKRNDYLEMRVPDLRDEVARLSKSLKFARKLQNDHRTEADLPPIEDWEEFEANCDDSE